MKTLLKRTTIAAAVAVACCLQPSWAQLPIDYRVSLTANAGSGDFAPYYMMSNVHGTLSQPYSTLLRAAAEKKMDTSQRFSYGFGIDVVGGYTSSTDYQRYDLANASMTANSQRPAPVWLQQLYGEVKYRSLFLSVGMKERGSVLLNDRLSSGDMTYSGNARPIPGARIGFIDFQDIPLTNGWVQICGALSYEKSTSSKWLEDHYNYLGTSSNIHLTDPMSNATFYTTDEWYCYKYVHFRTNPDKPFSFLIGLQANCQFGGKFHQYIDGQEIADRYADMTPSFSSFLKALIPKSGNSTYYEGNHVGTWDVMGRYHFKNGQELKLYYQSPWEDGSGIGKLNGFDGLYGIEYNRNATGIVENVVIEYIDLTNQSGPLHYSQKDLLNLGGLVTGKATGADDYYNNYNYNGYQLFGHSIGSPFLKSPIYNTDGFMRFTDNRIRGFHMGISGHVIKDLSYRLLASHRVSWGTPLLPALEKRHCTSVSIEGEYRLQAMPGLSIKAQIAFDQGSLLGDNFGCLVSVTYNGLLKL